MLCIDEERNELMSMQLIFARAAAGRFLDRINKINMIENGRNLNLVNPVNPV